MLITSYCVPRRKRDADSRRNPCQRALCGLQFLASATPALVTLRFETQVRLVIFSECDILVLLCERCNNRWSNLQNASRTTLAIVSLIRSTPLICHDKPRKHLTRILVLCIYRGIHFSVIRLFSSDLVDSVDWSRDSCNINNELFIV